jgi:molybdopterin biosynthesis enzyme MoaB
MTPILLETCEFGEEQTKEESRYSNINPETTNRMQPNSQRQQSQMTDLYVHLGGTGVFTQDRVIQTVATHAHRINSILKFRLLGYISFSFWMLSSRMDSDAY